jgi:hypothetical protein
VHFCLAVCFIIVDLHCVFWASSVFTWTQFFAHCTAVLFSCMRGRVNRGQYMPHIYGQSESRQSTPYVGLYTVSMSILKRKQHAEILTLEICGRCRCIDRSKNGRPHMRRVWRTATGRSCRRHAHGILWVPISPAAACRNAFVNLLFHRRSSIVVSCCSSSSGGRAAAARVPATTHPARGIGRRMVETPPSCETGSWQRSKICRSHL